MNPRSPWKTSLGSITFAVLGAALCWLSVRAEANLARHQRVLPPIESATVLD